MPDRPDTEAAEERLDELEEDIEQTREQTRRSGTAEQRDEPTTGFTPTTAENPVDPDDDVGEAVKGS
jgi:hypothetical protein